MWSIILLILIFSPDGQLLQIVEPLPGTTFQTMEVCERVGQKQLTVPLPAGQYAHAICKDKSTLAVKAVKPATTQT